ncbi:enkurin, partial [Kipferlia bialata]|eukprot:g13520.t1
MPFPSATCIDSERQNPPPPSPSVTPFSYTDVLPRKPPVPKRTEAPILGLVADRDYVKSNIVTARLSVPKPVGVEELDYTKRKGFGDIPKYLTRVKREIEEETELIGEVLEAGKPQ